MRRFSRGNVHKSRYGRVSKRKNNDDLIGSSISSSQATVTQPPKKKKPKMTSVSNNNNITSRMRDGKINIYSIGDMVWAKTGKYPIWPAIITNDPSSNKFYKNENDVYMFHIHYCNDAYKRNWIKVNQLTEFVNKSSIYNEFPKLLTQLARAKVRIKWNRAADEAECLVSMNKSSRIDAFFANNFLPHIDISLFNNHPVNDLKNNSNAETSTDAVQKRKLPALRSTDIASTIVENEQNSDHNNISTEERKPEVILENNFPKDHPRILIPELCKLFYSNGWVTGTGGGISIKYNDHIFIAPSGVQKERIESEDIFVQDMKGVNIEVPVKKLLISQCTPLFMSSYKARHAGAVIHTHSPKVVKLCLLNPEKELRVSGLEMIKGIYNEEKGRFYYNDEEVIIPIIENTKFEKDLVDSFKKALVKYPSTSAIVVRDHGIYVWGKDWQSAKTQCECYEYLFDIMIFKKTNKL